jgi:hypothetical protein
MLDGTFVLFDARSVNGISNTAFKMICVDGNAFRVAIQYYNVCRLNRIDSPWEAVEGGLNSIRFTNALVHLRPMSLIQCTLPEHAEICSNWCLFADKQLDFTGAYSSVVLPTTIIDIDVSPSKRSRSNEVVKLGRMDNIHRWDSSTIVRCKFKNAGIFSGIVYTLPTVPGADALWEVPHCNDDEQM